MQFQTFDKTDWMTFAGAEPFENGKDPIVSYDIKIDDLETFVIIDANGLYGQVLTPDGETVSTFTASVVDSARWVALSILDGHAGSFDTGALIDAGFVFESGN